MKKRNVIAAIKCYLDAREAVDDLEWEIEVRTTTRGAVEGFQHGSSKGIEGRRSALRAANAELWRIIGKSPP